MKNSTVICFLTLILGLQVAMGLKWMKRLEHHQKRFDVKIPTEQEIKDGIKMQIKARFDVMDQTCPEDAEFPDCSPIDSDLDEILDHVYSMKHADDDVGDMKSMADNVISTLKSAGKSGDEIKCTFESCMFLNIYMRHANGTNMQMCDLKSCELKRTLRARALLGVRDGDGEGKGGDKSDGKGGDSDGAKSDGGNSDGVNSDGVNSAGDDEFGDTEQWVMDTEEENEEDERQNLYDLCFIEGALNYCSDSDDNDGCAGKIADEMYSAMKKCIEQWSNIKKRTEKESIFRKVKRMMIEKEARERRKNEMKRLLEKLGV